MLSSKVSLKQIDTLPESSWDLSRDVLYVQIGCAGCSSQICFAADNVTSEVPRSSRNPEDLADLLTISREIKQVSRVHQGSSYIWSDQPGPCGEPCPHAEDIEAVTELMNERFGSELTTQRTE